MAAARRAKNGFRFQRLYDDGDIAGYASQSEADLALASMLAFYTEDKGQIDRMIRTSALNRKKWEDRPQYRERTIQRASNVSARYGSDLARMSMIDQLRALPRVS